MDRVENILISVERKYVVRMLAGNKTIELRRRPLRVAIGTKVWIYSTAPHALVEAVAKVQLVVSGSPENLWSKYKHQVGITKDEFDNYFLKATIAWGLILHDIQALRTAVPLAMLRRHTHQFHPPQFFMRLPDGSNTLELLQGNAH